MRRLIAVVLLIATPAFAAPEPSILNPSGLPLPRFVSLKYDEINVRVGPGQRYPIHWVYHRAHMPVEIIEEFAHWRRLRDYEGATGWVHKNATAGDRTALILARPQNLYDRPDATSAPVIRAEPMVIGKLKACEPDWCRLEINGRKGWIRKVDIWGVTREEVFGD